MTKTYARRHDERDQDHEGSVAFEVTKPIRLDQLDAELAAQLGLEPGIGMSAEGNLATASEETPVTVWVHLPDVKLNDFRKVVNTHEPEPTQADLLAELRAKAADGKDLTGKEIQQAVRLLLGAS